jgi:hypothetical protein
MSKNLVALTGLIYLYIALEQGFKREWPMSMVYLGYAFANVGLYLAVK